MAVNLTKACINLNEPVTSSELQAAEADYKDICNEVVSKSAKKKGFSKNDVKFVSDFRKNKGRMRKRRSKQKELEQLEKERKLKQLTEEAAHREAVKKQQIAAQQAREQAMRNGKVRKYTKEMRNRDILHHCAKNVKDDAKDTVSKVDDKLIKSASKADNDFDRLIYGTMPSDIEEEFEAILDDVNDS